MGGFVGCDARGTTKSSATFLVFELKLRKDIFFLFLANNRLLFHIIFYKGFMMYTYITNNLHDSDGKKNKVFCS